MNQCITFHLRLVTVSNKICRVKHKSLTLLDILVKLIFHCKGEVFKWHFVSMWKKNKEILRFFSLFPSICFFGKGH